LSENQRERLWVAEVVEGNQTRVAMVRVELGDVRQSQAGSELTLRKQSLLTTSDEVLAAQEIADALVAVEAEEIVIYSRTAEGWSEKKRMGIGQKKPMARDPHGLIFSAPNNNGFEASVAGMNCSGGNQPAAEWTMHCRESDDPWPIAQINPTDRAVTLKAFYNAARNYFTGVVTPSLGVDLPPFYSAALITRPADGAALLIGGIDGKVQLVENATLKPVAGARDWGSDFAALHSGCGAGTQIIASGSGEASGDSLRAYELPALEAVPASAALAMDGTVTALWTAPDGKSVFAVVRKSGNANAEDRYEVDRVTASCN
jgi:hypothetical protein